MSYNVNDGAKRVIWDLKELAGFTANENGAQRVAWIPVWHKTRDWFERKQKQQGLKFL